MEEIRPKTETSLNLLIATIQLVRDTLKAISNSKQLLLFITTKSFLEKVVLMMGSERSVIRKEARKLIVKLLSFTTDVKEIMIVSCGLLLGESSHG